MQELSHGRYHCQLKFFFRSNPYFLNEVIVKKYQVSFAGMWRFSRWGQGGHKGQGPGAAAV